MVQLMLQLMSNVTYDVSTVKSAGYADMRACVGALADLVKAVAMIVGITVPVWCCLLPTTV